MAFSSSNGDLAGFVTHRELAKQTKAPFRYLLSLPRRWALFVREHESFARLVSTGAGSPAVPANRRGCLSFYCCIRELALSSDNPFTQAAEKGARLRSDGINTGEMVIPSLLAQLATGDLERLGRIAGFDISTLGFSIALSLRSRNLEDAASQIEAEVRSLWRAEDDGLVNRPDGSNNDPSRLIHEAGNVTMPDNLAAGPALFQPGTAWGRSLENFTAHIHRHGAGILSRYGFFRWEAAALPALPPICPRGRAAFGGAPRPVLCPDPITLSDLSGYENQRALVINNTLAFLEGKPANNLLLYGDRGTGKSATVKAVCREYAGRGLRLLELRKEDMAELPAVLEFTASRGLRFVIFIDDLSFESMDKSFTGFKALVEGGTETRPPNTVIYATSNRRHLVKEGPADRTVGSGEPRSFDTMQEQLSLSDRFGLTVIFTTPSQEEYLGIAGFIAEKRGLTPKGDFRENALRWEKWFNGRSPRTASQFVSWLAGAKPFPWEGGQ
jgi:predicted AAA+ superfamily ATPase